MSNGIVIIGGAVGGLATALALHNTAYQITIIERDPEPPDIDPQHAFERWARPGVPQFRHAHILLARLQTQLRDRYPALLQQLLDAGLELATLEESVPAGVVDRIQKRPEDEDLRHLWGRRATFEYVLYRYVARMPNVTFRHSTQVNGLITEAADDQVRVRGVKVIQNQRRAEIFADVVIDASGKRSHSSEWLEPAGVNISVEGSESGFIYACRHYQLRDRGAELPRQNCGGNLDYLGYSTFFAEHGNYALTFGSPVDEKELVSAMGSADGFESLTSQFPAIKQWRDASTATSKVLGAGRFANRWRRYGTKGGKSLLGFFPVGDCHLETNPMYGRGCASAFVQAHVLADVLAQESAPDKRLAKYNAETHRLLNPYYEAGVGTDRVYHARARKRRGLSLPLGDRLVSYLFDAAFVPATHESPLVAREFLKVVQMCEPSSFGVRVAAGGLVLRSLIRTWMGRKVSAITPPPERQEFISRVLEFQEESAQ